MSDNNKKNVGKCEKNKELLRLKRWLSFKIKLSIHTYKVEELMIVIKIRENKILLKKDLQINLFTNL